MSSFVVGVSAAATTVAVLPTVVFAVVWQSSWRLWLSPEAESFLSLGLSHSELNLHCLEQTQSSLVLRPESGQMYLPVAPVTFTSA